MVECAAVIEVVLAENTMVLVNVSFQPSIKFVTFMVSRPVAWSESFPRAG
jgi:hypothetical protein